MPVETCPPSLREAPSAQGEAYGNVPGSVEALSHGAGEAEAAGPSVQRPDVGLLWGPLCPSGEAQTGKVICPGPDWPPLLTSLQVPSEG